MKKKTSNNHSHIFKTSNNHSQNPPQKLHGYYQNPNLLIKTEKKKRKRKRTWENQTPEGRRRFTAITPWENQTPKHHKPHNNSLSPTYPNKMKKKKKSRKTRITVWVAREQDIWVAREQDIWVVREQDALGPGWVAKNLLLEWERERRDRRGEREARRRGRGKGNDPRVAFGRICWASPGLREMGTGAGGGEMSRMEGKWRPNAFWSP